MNRKTKRHSPPPFQSSTIDSNKLSDSFSKWSKVLHLISPPNKKRRSISITVHQPLEETSLVVSRKLQDVQSIKQKKLNRRAMYIPNEEDNGLIQTKLTTIERSSSLPTTKPVTCIPTKKPIERHHSVSKSTVERPLLRRIDSKLITDGPRDLMHQWSMYKTTYQKLRQNALPLSEMIHLKKMLNVLKPINHRINREEDDDVPLGTLLEKNKLAPNTTTRTRYHLPYFHHQQQQQQPFFYYPPIVQLI
ncbi:hypothetical protein BD770DRAFT_383628 [Pilaira anomala]|nr:hypothetical protein BD770DRAFT_383628 [Pilaira anomala]